MTVSLCICLTGEQVLILKLQKQSHVWVINSRIKLDKTRELSTNWEEKRVSAPSADALGGWLSFNWWVAFFADTEEEKEAKTADCFETVKRFDETEGINNAKDFKKQFVENPSVKAMRVLLRFLLTHAVHSPQLHAAVIKFLAYLCPSVWYLSISESLHAMWNFKFKLYI